MELKDYIRVIRRRLKWFIAVMLVVLGGYYAVASLTEKKVYYSKAELYLTTTRQNGLFESIREFAPNSGRMNAQTRIETLKSPEFVEFVALYLTEQKFENDQLLFAKERKLADSHKERHRKQALDSLAREHSEMSRAELEQNFADQVEQRITSVRSYDPVAKRWDPAEKMGYLQEDYVKSIAALIERKYGIEEPKDTQIVRVTVESDDPVRAVEIANAFTDAAIYYNLEFDNRELEGAKVNARKRVKENQERLQKLRAEEVEYWKSHSLPGGKSASEGEVKSYFERLTALQGEVDGLISQRHKVEEEQVKQQERRRLMMQQAPQFVTPSDSLTQIATELRAEEKGLAALRERYTEAHPEVKGALRKIEDLRQREREERVRVEQEAEVKFRHAQSDAKIDIDLINQEIARKSQVLEDLQKDRIKVDGLRLSSRETTLRLDALEAENQRLLDFISRSELFGGNLSKPVDSFRNRRLDRQKDWWQESTDVMQMMWFMAVVAFLLSLGVVFLVEYMDTTLKTEHDIRRHLNLPVLGIIHHQRPGESVMLTVLPTKDPFAEKFYTAATIIKSAAHDLGLRTFVISSTVPREGKTTISVNLAVALARKGLKVILVDSDLRIPQIHEILGLDNSYGLSSVLEGRLKAKEVLADITDPGAAKKAGLQSFLQTVPVDSGSDNLRVLTSGPIPPDPLSLLESVRMKALIEELKTMADFVIFDTPPLTNVGDTLTLAGLADANIFVVGAGSVEQHQVTWAKHLLSNVEANVLGCFLNHATIEGRSYYYYYNEYKSYRARG